MTSRGLVEEEEQESSLFGGNKLDSDVYDGIEVWKLSNVVFLDDSPSILGRVVTVDQMQAIVDVAYNSSTSEVGVVPCKSTLKVHKLAELEVCPDCRLSDSPQSKTTKIKPKKCYQASVGGPMQPCPSSSSSSSSQHVAGIVQHHPLCILQPGFSPVKSRSANSSFELTADSPNSFGGVSTHSSLIRGYRPLAVHTTDEGPTMLLERVSDGKAFLVCSGHASSGAFISSSFVALGSIGGAKLNRCTVEQEGVNASESGLASQSCDDLDKFAKSPSERDVIDHSQTATERPQIGVKRKLYSSNSDKDRQSESSSSSSSSYKLLQSDKRQLLPSKSDTTTITSSSSPPLPPAIISCYNSQIFFLKDINGIIWPLSNGLMLKPSLPTCGGPQQTKTTDPVAKYGFGLGAWSRASVEGGAGGGGGGGAKSLCVLQPYHAVVARQYSVGKDVSVLLIVLGKCVYTCTCIYVRVQCVCVFVCV